MPCKLPRPFLGVTKKTGEENRPVTQIELEHGIYTGVQLSKISSDLVPLHEEHEARLERGIRLDEWCAMDYREKALIIASRRIRIAIENIRTEAEIKHTENQMRRK